jgi:hypothetical protein
MLYQVQYVNIASKSQTLLTDRHHLLNDIDDQFSLSEDTRLSYHKNLRSWTAMTVCQFVVLRSSEAA